MKVLKFGGISLKNATAIKKIKDILTLDSEKKLVVVSAFYGVTDLLTELIDLIKNKEYIAAAQLVDKIEGMSLLIVSELEICKNSKSFIKEKFSEIKLLVPALALLGETTNRSVDTFLSIGEKISSFVLADYLNSAGITTAFSDATQVVKTDNAYNKATVDLVSTKEKITHIILPLFENNACVVTAGFIGSDFSGATTTLGRGGSDYSASVFATCIKADILEIWKDVDGIMTTDPKIVKEALPVKSLSYTEASELAFFGAKILHPKTIRAAIMEGIPVIIKKTSDPFFAGTIINQISETRKKVKAIAFHRNVNIINICSEKMLGTYGFLSNVFDVFTKYKTPVDLITTSEINISVTIESNSDMSDIIKDLSFFSTVTVTENVAIISLVGEEIKYTPGIAARSFGALSKINILMVSMGASDANLSIIVDQKDMEKSVKFLHHEFFEKKV